MATIRLVEAPHDERFIDASNSLRKIASTLDEVPDEMILKLATCNIVSEGTLSQLIAAPLEQVGFMLPTQRNRLVV